MHFKIITHFFIFILGLSSTLWAQSSHIPYGVFVYDESKSSMLQLKGNKNFVVDHVNAYGYELYGTEVLVNEFLQDQNLFSLTLKELESKRATYPSFEKITEDLKNLAKLHPKIFKLLSIGKSVQGRDLWVMKVSDEVDLDELEPELKFVGNMHGDEIVGRELLMIFLADLAKSYALKDPRILKLINNNEIYIMPSLNPDGAELKQRGNANHVDLNRDFPDFTTNDNQNTWIGRAPETISMMKFQAQRNFTLSANFHGGAVVVNYPWDTTEKKFPLEDLVKDISLAYARENLEMSSSSEFVDGIVNGFDWYEVDGGMQDWSYHWHQDLQVTVELSQNKWPNYSSIKDYYKDNRTSFLSYLENAKSGLALNLSALTNTGRIEITETRLGQYLGSFSFIRGEFHKVLEGGEYQLKIFDNSNKLLKTLSKVVDLNSGNESYEQL